LLPKLPQTWGCCPTQAILARNHRRWHRQNDAADAYLARIRPRQSGQQCQHGGFATTAWSHQRDAFARLHCQIEITQHGSRIAVGETR
jgi:hypothetical protein